MTPSLELSGNGFKLANFREIHKGKVLYGFDLIIDSMALKICECLLIQVGSDRFISFPSREYEKDGEKKHKKLIWIPAPRKQKLDDLVSNLIKSKFEQVEE